MCKGGDNCGNEQALFHPLNPLTKEEIEAAVGIAKKEYGQCWGDRLRFEMISLDEPAKSAVRSFPSEASGGGDVPLPRQARANVFEAGASGVTTLIIDLASEQVVSKQLHETAHPMIQLEEFTAIEECVRADPEFIAGCAKRGITNMDLVCIDPWSSGGDFGKDDETGRHISHVFCWTKSSANDNLYAHPIDGLNAVVDVKEMKVLRVDDHGVIPVPTQDVNYDRDFIKSESIRADLKPLHIEQPQGVSFSLTGRTIQWHEWSILVGFNAREALTLHNVSYGGRPIVYRMSLAEMVVPYGSPREPHFRKNVFDIGEYGIGKLANSLALGCDCLGAIRYLDAFINDTTGTVICIPNAICIHEEDAGIAWKHWDFRTERTEVRRSRRLVISSVSTVGNYEYGSYWYFYFDGTIEFEMKATGIINTVACEPGTPQKYGTEVSPGVVGHIHQHLFCARLDMSVDGDQNTVYSCDTQAEPIGPDNPHGNAFFVQQTKLDVEGGWCRNPDTERYWKFTNPSKLNHVGQPTAYKLEPLHSISAFNHPKGTTSSRMKFIRNHLWLTAYDKEERFPAGEFVNGSDGSDGVATFADRGRAIDNADVVAWHVFGLHHLPRTEDFPVQPCVMTGFKLMPTGFFDRNPNLNLPYEKDEASKDAAATTCCQ